MSGHMASEGDINAMVKEVSITRIFTSINIYQEKFCMIFRKKIIYLHHFW